MVNMCGLRSTYVQQLPRSCGSLCHQWDDPDMYRSNVEHVELGYFWGLRVF